MAQNASGIPASPSVAKPIGATGLRGQVTGVTRFGAKAGMIVAGVLGMIVLAIVYGVSNSGSHRAVAINATGPVPQILPTAGPLYDIPGDDATPASLSTPAPHSAKAGQQHGGNGIGTVIPVQPAPNQAPPALPEQPVGPALARTTDVPDIRPVAPAQLMSVSAATPDPAAARKLQRQLEAQQSAQLAQQAADAARRSAIIVTAGPSNGVAAAANAAPAAASATASTAGAGSATAAAGTAGSAAATDPATASQKAKAEFVSLQKSSTASDYLTTPRQSAISPYEVQAGSIIPAILVTGINSDLPGQMIGQVSQNVYDSKTGQYLLIPAGSKLAGKYDSQVVNGQSRVLVAWQRIIFPDTSFIDIDGMQGTDTAGYSGFTGKVDDHSGKLFRNAILFSLIGAGTALLQPRTAIAAITPLGAAVQMPSVASQVAGQVGTNVGQAVQQQASQGVQQQPTIEVRPGYLFNIIVDRDLVLPAPYTK
jgi:type IV secretion system protein VirB10